MSPTRLVATLLAFLLPASAALAQADRVADGSRVSIEFTIKLPDDTEVVSNIGAEPLTYVSGRHELPAALEKALTGLKVGDTKTVKLEEPFGPVDPGLYRPVPIDQIPREARREGAVLTGQRPDGSRFQVRVHQVKEDTVVLDFNHPLAGKTLIFEVKILKIEPAAAP